MKLMLVGQENVGKTSLGKCFLKSNVPERKILKRLLGGGGGASGNPAQPALGAMQVSNATLSTDGIDIHTRFLFSSFIYSSFSFRYCKRFFS